MPAVARDAASVILLRNNYSGDGIDVLMVRRHARSDFAGDMHVFPGGAVEEADCEEGMASLCDGMCTEDAASILGDVSDPARALGLFVAGIRETFEEAGILLARESSGEFVSYRDERAAHFAAIREALRDEKLAFNDMIAAENLKLAAGSLVYFAHWITPEFSPIRFDTRFFLAPAPQYQEALHDNVETTAHLWITPQEALARSENGTFAMLPPTIINLMALTRFSTVQEALHASAGQEIPVVAPQVSFEDGKLRLHIPEDGDSLT